MHFRPRGVEAYLERSADRLAEHRPGVLQTPRIFQSSGDPRHLLYISEWPSREAHLQRSGPRLVDTTAAYQSRPFEYSYYRWLHRFESVGQPIDGATVAFFRSPPDVDELAVLRVLRERRARIVTEPACVARLECQNL